MALNKYGGFADGFTQGFGLIGDVKDRELQRNRLEEQTRQSDLDREATTQYRQDTLDANAEKLAFEKNKLAWDKDPANPKNIETQATSDLREAQAGLAGAQSTKIVSDEQKESQRLSSIEKEQTFAINANAYIEHLKTGSSAGLRDEAWRKRADELFSSALGGLTNPLNAAHPSTEADMVSFQKVLETMQSGGEVDRGAVTGLLNMVLASNNERQLGAELTEETTPHAGYLNGKGWRIESKQISPNWNIVNGQLTGTVDVVVVNDRGERAGYNAPLTFKRGGVQMDESGNPVIDEVTGKPMKAIAQPISTQDLINSAAGYFKYAQYARQFKDEIASSAARLYDLKNGEGALTKEVNHKVSQYQIKYGTGEKAMMESPIKGMTNAEFIQDTKRLEEYMTFAVLDPSKNVVKATHALDGVISQVADLGEIKDLERTVGRKLDRQELLLASHFFSPDGKIDKGDIEAWKDFKVSLLREEDPLLAPTGMEVVQKAFDTSGLRGL